MTEPVQVWRGAYGDPVPLFGPLPGRRIDEAVAYEFALPDRYAPRPGRNPLERVFVLTDVGVGMAQPYWLSTRDRDGRVVSGLDADRADRPTPWYVDLLQVTDRGSEIIVRDLYIDVIIPIDGRHNRMLDLDEYADAIEAGNLPIAEAVDGLRRWQRFLDTYVHRDRDPRDEWTDFPPKAMAELAALPEPFGPIVTWEG